MIEYIPITCQWTGSISPAFILTQPIIAPQTATLDVGVKSISTYNGFYNINNTNNVFTYTSATQHTIIIAPGVYSIPLINAAIKQAMVEIFSENQAAVDAFNILVYLPNLGTTMTTSTFSVNFTVANSINLVIGFNSQIYLPNNIYISENPANITNNNAINVTCSATLNGSLTASTDSRSLTPSNIIYTLPILASPGKAIGVDVPVVYFIPCSTKEIKTLNFSLVNQSGQIVENLGQNFIITLMFRITK